MLSAVDNMNMSLFANTSNVSDSDDEETQSRRSGFNVILILCIIYVILFCCGFTGNIWVISLVIRILRTIKRKSQNSNIFVYILSLAVVDSLVLLNVPMLVTDMLIGRWVFGYHLCKLFWIIESVNKVLAKFIIAAMSLDRFLSVCKSKKNYFVRTSFGTLLTICGLATIVSFSLYPVYINTHEVPFGDIYEDSAENETNSQEYNVQTKCLLQMPELTMKIFALYLFVIGFCLPSVVIATFYSCILCKVHRHASSFRNNKSQIPLKRVTFATFSLMIFYFVCWMPFWITTVYAAFFNNKESMSIYVVYMIYISHVLVYVNSAFNWVLYASMNKNLNEKKSSREDQASKQRKHSLQSSRLLASGRDTAT